MVRFTRPSPFLHTASDQKLEPGKAWERGCSIVICERLTLLNTLTTNNNYSHLRNSVASLYQLAQSVLKIGSALAVRGRWVGALLWLTVHGGCCSWL